MTNNAPCGTSRAVRRVPFAPVLMATVALLSFAACSPKKDTAQSDSGTAHNVTLTAAQQQHIKLYTVTPSRFHKTIETSGIVDFDNDQATSVIAPISGPVTRLLVSPGDKVRKGQPLALVDSSDFAAATSAYSKAVATARNARHLADMDADLLQHNGVSQREADQAKTDAVNAEADRDAALQTLASLNVDPQAIKNIQQGKPVSHIAGMIRAPISGTVAERLITSGQLLQAGTTQAFTIADLSRVWVMAQVFDSDLGADRNRRGITQPFRHRRKYLGGDQSRHPFGGGAGGGGKSGRPSQKADVCPRADPGAPGKQRLACAGFRDFAR